VRASSGRRPRKLRDRSSASAISLTEGRAGLPAQARNAATSSFEWNPVLDTTDSGRELNGGERPAVLRCFMNAFERVPRRSRFTEARFGTSVKGRMGETILAGRRRICPRRFLPASNG